MKVEKSRGVGQGSGPRPTAAAPGFAPTLDAPQRVVAASSLSGVTPLDAILALQADDRPAQRRARQARRGLDVLDALERLEEGLVLGRAPGSLRADLENLRCGGEITGEDGLDAVLREIDTRLAVELAKLERTLRGV